MALPIFNTQDRTLSMMQTQWASQINPVLSNPLTNPLILKGINLVIGANTINHMLGHTLQGWVLTDVDGAAVIYRSQPKNNLTLTLTSDAAVVADILVY